MGKWVTRRVIHLSTVSRALWISRRLIPKPADWVVVMWVSPWTYPSFPQLMYSYTTTIAMTRDWHPIPPFTANKLQKRKEENMRKYKFSVWQSPLLKDFYFDMGSSFSSVKLTIVSDNYWNYREITVSREDMKRNKFKEFLLSNDRLRVSEYIVSDRNIYLKCY